MIPHSANRNPQSLKALTIDAPWAWAIIAGHKPVENRGWKTRHRGPLAIHASRNQRSDAVASQLFERLEIDAPSAYELDHLRGRVLGVVDLVDVWEDPSLKPFVTETGRAEFGLWWLGPCGWELANPVPAAAPALIPGKQGLWILPEAFLEAGNLLPATAAGV